MKYIVSFLISLIGVGFLTAQVIDLQQIATGFSIPVEIAHTNDDRLFIVEKSGIIKIVQSGSVLTQPFLNITDRVNSIANERGLLGLAFHPNYATNNTFFVYYTNASGDTTVSKFTATANLADASSEVVLLNITQPFSNHNGGHIDFGSDGYLYIGTGDGGAGGDPNNYAQNGNSLLGKLLRIDVDNGTTYSIPADNPFVGNAAVADEIFSIGLRNPWKFSFDTTTNDIWIADVGQNAYEEINHSTSALGLNYGWRCYEGNNVYNNSGCGGSYTFPVAVYSHSSGGCSITGGYVYRGAEYPNMQGKYFFSDYCNTQIGMLNPTDNSITWFSNSFPNIASFGLDNSGTLYALGIGNGILYKVIDSSLGVEDINNKQIEVQLNNPVTDFLTFKSDAIFDSFSIINTNGILISQENKKAQTATLNLSDLEEGVYFLQLSYNEGQKVITKKIIKK